MGGSLGTRNYSGRLQTCLENFSLLVSHSAVGEKVFLFPSLAEQVRLCLNSAKVKQSVGVGVL